MLQSSNMSAGRSRRVDSLGFTSIAATATSPPSAGFYRQASCGLAVPSTSGTAQPSGIKKHRHRSQDWKRKNGLEQTSRTHGKHFAHTYPWLKVLSTCRSSFTIESVSPSHCHRNFCTGAAPLLMIGATREISRLRSMQSCTICGP